MHRAGRPRDRGQTKQLHTFAQMYLHRGNLIFQAHEKESLHQAHPIHLYIWE